MHFSKQLAIAGAAVAVSAHGSPRGHGHGQFHAKRADDVAVVLETVTEYVTVYADETSSFGQILAQATSSSTTTTSTVAPTTTSTTSTTLSTSTYSASSAASSSASASSSSSSSSNSDSAHVYTDFKCTSSSKRATLAEITYQGNTGTPYGCNMMLVDSSIADSYSYSIDFTNVASETYQVICWNKYGSDGLLDGWYEGKGAPITFSIAAGASQAVAFQANTQGACAIGPGAVPVVTKSGTNPLGGSYETGAYAGTWAEFDFGNAQNGGTWSGYDVSVLLAQRNAVDVYGLQLCSADCSNTCSSINPGGTTYNNAYVLGMEAVDGTGGNCPESKIKITAKVGYSG